MSAVVVGAGIAGSSLAVALRETGTAVTVISDPMVPPDSLAGAVVLRRAWHKGDERALFDRSMQLYARRGIEVVRGAEVTSYQRPGQSGRPDKDWGLVHPRDPLVPADLERRVSRSAAESLASTLGADRVFWCPGVYVSGVSGVTWGVTWVHRDPAVLAQTRALTVHHLAPYKTIVAGVVGGQVRLGSSSAASVPKAAQQGEAILNAMREAGLINTLLGWSPILGRRCTFNGSDLGGLHRTGYALAPAMAERLAVSSHPTSAVESRA